MTIQRSYTQARAELASLLDEVVNNREGVIIRRRNRGDVALIAADELSSLMETVHLLKSPANARRLFDSLEGARRGEGTRMTVEELRREFGLDESG